jgi:hypothetical protein
MSGRGFSTIATAKDDGRIMGFSDPHIYTARDVGWTLAYTIREHKQLNSRLNDVIFIVHHDPGLDETLRSGNLELALAELNWGFLSFCETHDPPPWALALRDNGKFGLVELDSGRVVLVDFDYTPFEDLKW